jgi:hypothetical protein
MASNSAGGGSLPMANLMMTSWRRPKKRMKSRRLNSTPRLPKTSLQAW